LVTHLTQFPFHLLKNTPQLLIELINILYCSLHLSITNQLIIMKNLKKLSRSGLKSITGGVVYVSCPMPSGIPARCPGTVCPTDPCKAMCIRSYKDCQS